MRRGRIFIYLALIIIVAVAGAALYLWRRTTPSKPAVATQTTPQVRYVGIITAGQNILPGTIITETMLNSIQIPEDKVVQGLFTNKGDVASKYAKIAIMQGVPITDSMVSTSPGSNLQGSLWAASIPQGLTAVSIPITELSSAAYGIRDGDYVNVIVSMVLVDVDPALQTALPNKIEQLQQLTTTSGNTSTNTGLLDITPPSGPQGHFEVAQVPTDPVSNTLLYVVPGEDAQRGRLVTQMIMQNIQVLRMGKFPLPGEAGSDQLNAAAAAATPTPQPANQQTQTAPVIIPPDIITVMVTPQDAVTLTYLMYLSSVKSAQITLTLRNPNDQTPITEPDAAMLEYLLTQYNIPVPAKLPYSVQPRIENVQLPVLQNNAAPQP